MTPAGGHPLSGLRRFPLNANLRWQGDALSGLAKPVPRVPSIFGSD